MISAVIVSYNDRQIMGRCLSALAEQLSEPGDEIIVVDNGSTDGVLEDLRADSRVKLIENGKNAGFPVGCNIGFAAAAEGNDIFLLNNDAVLAKGALAKLREALYSAGDIGAVGAVSNNALEQNVPGIDRGASVEEALLLGAESMRKERTSYEFRSRLTGFAVLLKRELVDRLIAQDGFFLDPRFSPGYFEDEDLGMRTALAGYRQILCHNAFIYHKGGTGFASHPEAMSRGREKFIDKWGFDVWAYIGILDDYREAVGDFDAARILEIDCGMGVNLAHLQYLYPECTVIGIEREPLIARIAAQLIDVICADPEEALVQAEIAGTPESQVLAAHTFDLVFVWDGCSRSREPGKFLAGLRRLLKDGGRLITEDPPAAM
ncbi:MAG: glycosyltransferase [Lachnospiraceae bacterium]|nr:glycosyltransferase [Lachnospiraceae bacterium]